MVIKYNQRCDECGKMCENTQLTKGFGKRKCFECASYLIISKQHTIRLPAFVMKQTKLKPLNILKVFIQSDGSLKLRRKIK